MALARKPNSNQILSDSKQITPEQKAFINQSRETAQVEDDETKKGKTVPVMLRVDSEMLARIDRTAKRLGLKRAAFFVSSAAERMEKLERMD